MILDRSFWSRKDRDEFRKSIEHGGAESRLVYLEVEKEALWQRICDRGVTVKDANSALDISRDLFEAYVASFERPANEQEHKISAVQLSAESYKLWPLKIIKDGVQPRR